MIEIAFCTDNNYAMPAGVMVYSVCKHTDDVHFNAIIPEDFSGDNRSRLTQIVQSFNASIDFITIPDGFADGFPVYLDIQPEHISIAAYYRLFLGRLLPDEMEKVIYLDCDLMCQSSLKELWDTELGDSPLACISEIPYEWQKNQERLGYDDSLGYFNSGVLLINLIYWREQNVIELFFSYIRENHDLLVYHDQDVLNYVFRGKVIFLPPKFNAIDMLFHKGFNDFAFPKEQVREARYSPVIVHFTYKHKPWFLGGSHTYRDVWLSLLAQTPWKGTRLKVKKATSLKGHIANILVRLGVYRYHDDYITLT